MRQRNSIDTVRYAYSSTLACTTYTLFRSLETKRACDKNDRHSVAEVNSLRWTRMEYRERRRAACGIACTSIASRHVASRHVTSRTSRHVTSRILRTPLAMRGPSSLSHRLAEAYGGSRGNAWPPREIPRVKVRPRRMSFARDGRRVEHSPRYSHSRVTSSRNRARISSAHFPFSAPFPQPSAFRSHFALHRERSLRSRTPSVR